MKAMNLFWTLAFACVAVSCSDDMNDPGDKGIDEKDGQKAYLTVTISTVSDDGMGTRALTRAGEEPSNPNSNGAGWGEDGNGSLGELPGKNEAVIHDINIFLIKDETNLDKNNQLDNINSDKAASIKIDGYGYKEGLSLDGSVGGDEPNHGSTNVTVTMREDLDETPQKFLVYCIVNAGKKLTDSDDITTLDKLRDYLQNGGVNSVIKENEDNVNTADNFVMSTHKMWGEKGYPSSVSISSANTPENPAHTAVYVERLAARIDVAYKAQLDFDNENSPVHNKGTFTLTGYMVVNQWNGSTKMFKQVTPVVKNYTEDISNYDNYADSPKKYLGDEVWRWNVANQPAGEYNFVWSEMFKDKTNGTANDEKWDNSYTNHFAKTQTGTLNNAYSFKDAPTEEKDLSYKVDYNGERTFFPIAYVRENTMNTRAQLNGYSTGVIFRTKFDPNENFKLTQYNQETGSIDEVELKKHDVDKFEFLTAEHFDGKAVHKVVYADVKSVAARAFCIESKTDTKGLLKGFMNGWADDATATLQDAQDAIAGMSEKNLLSQLFKKYLNEQMEGVEDFSQLVKDSDKKSALTYSAFVESQEKTHADLLNKTPLSEYDAYDIANLAEWYGVYFFRNGQSYHKYWIRHDDNENDNMMGVMEFAIVRNNVYQLDVTGVRGLGDPLPYTPGKDDPGTPDESNEISIDVTVYVKDWVRRYNDGIIL